LGPPIVGVFGDSELGFPGALVAMAMLLVVMIAMLFRNDRRRTTVHSVVYGLPGQ
jgi:hypothetical protein